MIRLAKFAAPFLLVVLFGCSPEELTLSLEETDAFIHNVFETIQAEDFDAYLEHCVQPDDVGVNGESLMRSHEGRDGGWRDAHKRRFERLIQTIGKAGGVDTLAWKRPGQVQGYFHDENEFVGNMYLEVMVGMADTPMALEFGATYKSERGRLLGADSGVRLLTWKQYQYQKM
jgi:hypothetical protein